MASSDLTTVTVDLPSADPLVVAEESLDTLVDLAPDFTPRDGSPEVLVIEATATVNAEVRGELRALPGDIAEALWASVGVERSMGAKATGQILVTLDHARTMTVPAGTRLGDTAAGIFVETVSDVAFAAASSGTLPVRALDPGSSAHVLVAGTAVDIRDTIPGSVTAVITTGLSGGTDPESDAEYEARIATYSNRITSSLVRPTDFTNYLLSDPRIARATTIDLYEPGGTIGEDVNQGTSYVYGYGEPVSDEIREEKRAEMHDMSSASVTIHCEPADIVTQPIALTVHALTGHVHADVESAVEAVLRSRVTPDGPNGWPWGRDILVTEIIATAADATGVDYVVSVTTPAADVPLDEMQLALAGTITVTVT